MTTTTYYKAVRFDYSTRGGVRWTVGETTTHPSSTKMLQDAPSTYLSLSVEPAETLIGGSIPARLLEVEPVGDTVTSSSYSHKRGVLAAHVVRELPAWQVLGPNGREVATLIERVRCMTRPEATRVAAAWGDAKDAAWGAARGAAKGDAKDAAWGAAWGDAKDAAWGAARGAARGAAWGAAWSAAKGAAWGAARGVAWDAAWDAAIALVVRDLITPEQFDTLAGPLLSVLGPLSEMPVPEWATWGSP